MDIKLDRNLYYSKPQTADFGLHTMQTGCKVEAEGKILQTFYVYLSNKPFSPCRLVYQGEHGFRGHISTCPSWISCLVDSEAIYINLAVIDKLYGVLYFAYEVINLQWQLRS